jgi:hypothetical protein
MVACGDRKIFAVHAHFAFLKEMQNVHELQKRMEQRQSLCLDVSMVPMGKMRDADVRRISGRNGVYLMVLGLLEDPMRTQLIPANAA